MTHSTPIAIVASMDPVLRDGLAASLMLGARRTVTLRHDLTGHTLRRVVSDSTGILDDTAIHLEHPCSTCAMSTEAIPTLRSLVDAGRWEAIVLAVPVTADPHVIAHLLSASVPGAHLARVVTAVDSRTVQNDLLGDDTVAERGLTASGADERSIGEVLAAQVEYADIVAVDEEDPVGHDLVAQLAAADAILTGHYDVDDEGVFGHRHSCDSAHSRLVRPHAHPSTAHAWTIELEDERPFHPDRLVENIEWIGAGRLRARGEFWVPTRPHSVCRWEGAGGQLAIGVDAEQSEARAGLSRDAGGGADGAAPTPGPVPAVTALPRTRLVITGVDPADAARVRQAFQTCLLTEEEWADGLAPWLGRADALDPWLGQRAA
ncbi:GTP-binding protein [Helcobacillus massiliensis]|uniref:G3E family GTPase n=1 Tax=Helcobacillus massiliensis TaxID=521392 RepID=A0A839QYW5_9MICO|nr:GTP-binding protein [Helcobacillus massiliensis]MBB3023151.1 G3E family GTPase [Helcobacillus massiliensis]